MIYLILIVTFVILLYAIDQRVKHDKWHDLYWDENRLHQETLSKFENASEEINQLNNQIEMLEDSLRAKDADKEETGNFVIQRKLRPATSQTYKVVFDMDINGQRILEHLAQLYCRNAFASTDRETNYKLGQQHVVNHIINQINKANDPDYTEELNND
ncbi:MULTISPECIES: Bbp19 family protein [unclassified Acinetobacter]|uniref:Bbp19 family protein n=1 Tax=unclassified Acinetobacter TaxID=196816 RepID=UPI00124FA712|nr:MULTISPECIES: hypothetical protein [unclassified Acinetobacter]